MKIITVAEVVSATEGELICGNAETEISAVSTDSRKLEAGSLCVVWVGENFDGHDFIEKALEMCIRDRDEINQPCRQKSQYVGKQILCDGAAGEHPNQNSHGIKCRPE